MARKDGPTAPGTRCGLRNDVICSQRRGQSQKPEEIYELIEDLVPNGKQLANLYTELCAPGTGGVATSCASKDCAPLQQYVHIACTGRYTSRNATEQPLLTAGCYLEIFGRQNNLREYWVTVGNEVSGSTASPAQFKARLEELRAQRPGTRATAAD